MVGERLCKDGNWQQVKMAPGLLTLPWFMGRKASKLRKWLYLIRKYTPLASGPWGGIIIILGWLALREAANGAQIHI